MDPDPRAIWGKRLTTQVQDAGHALMPDDEKSWTAQRPLQAPARRATQKGHGRPFVPCSADDRDMNREWSVCAWPPGITCNAARRCQVHTLVLRHVPPSCAARINLRERQQRSQVVPQAGPPTRCSGWRSSRPPAE